MMENKKMNIYYIDNNNISYVVNDVIEQTKTDFLGVYYYETCNITKTIYEERADIELDMLENLNVDFVKRNPKISNLIEGITYNNFSSRTYFVEIFYNNNRVFVGFIVTKTVDFTNKKIKFGLQGALHGATYIRSVPETVYDEDQKIGLVSTVLNQEVVSRPYEYVISDVTRNSDEKEVISIDTRRDLRASNVVTNIQENYDKSNLIFKNFKLMRNVITPSLYENKLVIFCTFGSLYKEPLQTKTLYVEDLENYTFDISMEPLPYGLYIRGGTYYNLSGDAITLKFNDISNVNLLPVLPKPLVYSGNNIVYDYDGWYAENGLTDPTTYQILNSGNEENYISNFPSYENLGKKINLKFDAVKPRTEENPTQDEIDIAVRQLAFSSIRWFKENEAEEDMTSFKINGSKILNFDLADRVVLKGYERIYNSHIYDQDNNVLRKHVISEFQLDSVFLIQDDFYYTQTPNKYFVNEIVIEIDENGIVGSLHCNVKNTFSAKNLPRRKQGELLQNLTSSGENFIVGDSKVFATYDVTIPSGTSDTGGYISKILDKISDGDFGDLSAPKIPDNTTSVLNPKFALAIPDECETGFIKHVYDNEMFCKINTGQSNEKYYFQWDSYPVANTATFEIRIYPIDNNNCPLTGTSFTLKDDLTFTVLIEYENV